MLPYSPLVLENIAFSIYLLNFLDTENVLLGEVVDVSATFWSILRRCFGAILPKPLVILEYKAKLPISFKSGHKS